MARLPGYESNRSVETGSQFLRPRSTNDQTARAAQGLGGVLASIGGQLQQVDDRLNAKLEAEAKRTEALEIEANVIRTDTDERLRWQEYKANAPESGSGVYEGFMTEHDKRWQERVAEMPIERRATAEVKFLRNRERMSLEVSSFEQQQRQRFVVGVSKEKSASLTASIQAGTMDHETAVGEVNSYVDGLALPPNAAAHMKRVMGMSVDGARIEREIATNAPGALRDLTANAPGSPRSSNPHVQRVVEAANRHGVPLEVILPGVYGESKFDPTVDMSKKINPKTGEPYSSAYGYGQMLNSNWAEVGMEKSADPDVQAEATARIFKKRIDHLQRNGIEVNATNVWGAHFVGPGAYTRLLGVDPNTPLRDVLLPMYGNRRYVAATTGNGSLLQDGATVGQTLEAIKAYTEKNVKAVEGFTKSGTAPTGPITIGGTTLSTMVADDLPRYLAKAQAAAAVQSEAAMQEASRATVSSGPLNGYDPAHRNDADKVFKADGVGSQILQGSDEAVGRAAAFVRVHAFLPPDASAAAQKLMTGVDMPGKVKGYELGLSAYAANPIDGLQHSKFDPDMQKRITLYATIRSDDGVDPVEAVRRTEAILSPENQKRATTEEFQKSVKEKRESLTFSTISSETNMKEGWAIGRLFGYGVDRTPVSDKVKDFMLDQFRDSFTRHAQMFGNTDAALTAAKNDMKRVVGVTKVFGAEQATFLPVERMLPKLPDGTHSYVKDQAMYLLTKDVERAKDLSKGIKDVAYGDMDTKNLVLKPTAQTWLDVRAGRPPSYDLLYIDKTNSTVREVQLGFRPDFNAGYEAYKNAVETQEYGARSAPKPPAPPSKGKLAGERAKQEADAAVAATRTGSERRNSMPSSVMRDGD